MLPQARSTSIYLQWGNTVLTLDNPNFCVGFLRGRESYCEECEEEPRRMRELVATDFLKLIALSDARSGHYRFDHEGINNLEEYLGVFLGYVTAPLVNLAPEVQ
jgi:hypothetical protein